MITVLLFALFGSSIAACPAGYQQINGGDCFKLYSTPVTFDSGEAQCVQDGGHLASVHSINEQNALAALMGGMATPLIGMKCTDSTVASCTWKDGSAVDYSNFPGGAPVIGYGSCVHLASTDTSWYSWNCVATIGSFLCRVPFNGAPTCTGDYVAFNGGCAAVKKNAKTQANAEADCALDGGHLASIHSDSDNTFYSQLASNQGLNNNIYIGLQNTCTTCAPNGNSYTWTDATQYEYDKFASPNFPNTIFGKCVQLMMSAEFGTLGQWTNIPCETALAYVCWKANGGDVAPKAPSQCPGIQFFYDQGTIYSPNFPLSIPAGQTCEYILATSAGTKAGVTFPSFSTDAATTLSLYDGLDELTPKNILSGAVDSQVSYQSSTNVMKMIFAASASPSGQGWQANFVTINNGPVDPVTSTTPPEPARNCPLSQYTADVTVFSPNWPNPYPTLVDCMYFINAQGNRKLTIEFTFYDTEQCCDYVVVYDGPNNNSRVLAIISGLSDASVKTYTSTGSTLTLEFTSGSIYKGKKGWTASVYNV